MSAPRLFSLACACLLTLTPLSAQDLRTPSARVALFEYREFIRQYRGGETVPALQGLLAHNNSWLAVAVEAMATARDSSVEDLEAAALLHTEAVSGAWVRNDSAIFQLTAARRFVDLKRGGFSTPYRLPAEFRRSWHLIVTWYLQKDLQYPALISHLDATLARYPDDADVLLAQGTFYEIFGWSEKSPARSTMPAPRLFSAAMRNRRGYLIEAERVLRAAVESAPALEEARLRLGRVLNELGHPDDGLETLRPLLLSRNLPIRYLATMFSGAAHERLGHFDQAIASYRSAAVLNPQCQTPLVALTAALRAKGDQDASYDIALRTAIAGTRCVDPWWDYKSGQWAWRVDAVLDTMRAAVR